ncbi:sensor histidine kinase [Pseudoduganella aquatica]|uniref:sensor histidine kinase n=1 Tax=Pseudoduganella aquatica TaxID=2660641 RepID=UPI002AA2A5C6|nr:sensor histidine kinase [Pseudoduganella aquatica]
MNTPDKPAPPQSKPAGHGTRRDGQAAGRRATDSASSYEQLRELSAALQAIREEERTHIARELHDDLGQLLATLRVDLSLLQQQGPATPQAVRQMRSMDKLLQRAITSLRRIAADLRPHALDEGGLYYALQTLRQEFTQRHGIACQLDAHEQELVLDDRYSTAVFRIVQESLTNVSRHAGADHVWITLQRQDDRLDLTIEDNGRGISSADLNKAHSFGLLGMRERVWALDGAIDIQGRDSSGDGGTRIVIELPLPGN